MHEKTLAPFKKKLIAVIQKHCPNARIYLFGSRATGANTNISDIDLAIDAGKRIAIQTLGAIKDDVAALNIPFFVDIVDVHRASNEMKKSIHTEGILWSA